MYVPLNAWQLFPRCDKRAPRDKIPYNRTIAKKIKNKYVNKNAI